MSAYLVNGEITDLLSVEDRSLHYGDGVFETLVIDNGTALHWDAHLERLDSGCRRLRIPVPDNKLLVEEAEKLLTAQSQSIRSRCVLKIIVSRGVGRRGYKPPPVCESTRIIGVFPYPDYPASYFERGVKITRCKTPLSCNPVLAGIKHLNRLEQVMAQDEWNDPRIIEGIMLNVDQQVVEGTMSNIFWVTNSHLFTPDLSKCGVEGVTRANILGLAKELQIPTTIDYFDMKDLLSADEIFLSNSVFGILPVNAVDDLKLQAGPLTHRLMNELK